MKENEERILLEHIPDEEVSRKLLLKAVEDKLRGYITEAVAAELRGENAEKEFYLKRKDSSHERLIEKYPVMAQTIYDQIKSKLKQQDQIFVGDSERNSKESKNNMSEIRQKLKDEGFDRNTEIYGLEKLVKNLIVAGLDENSLLVGLPSGKTSKNLLVLRSQNPGLYKDLFVSLKEEAKAVQAGRS